MNYGDFRTLIAFTILTLLLLDLAQLPEARRRPRSRRMKAKGKVLRKRKISDGVGTTPPPYYPGYRSSSAFCYRVGEGFHPNEKDCTRFIRCIRQGVRRNGRTIMTRYDFSCAPGTVYDPDIFVCNYPGEGGTPEDCGAPLPAPEPEPLDDAEPRTLPPPEPLAPPPTTTTMAPCQCNISGTLRATTECDPETGGCLCKKFVDGAACDTCKHAYFNFEVENENGCSPCFCFGHSKTCKSAEGYNQVPVRSQFAKGFGKWTAEDETGAPIEVEWVKDTQEVSVTGTRPGQIIYYMTPPSYLGEQRRSFNKKLNFTMYVKMADSPAGESAQAKAPVVILEGSGLKASLAITNQRGFSSPFPTTVAQNYSITVHPDYGWEPKLSEPQFLKLLSNITSFKIKGTFTPQGTSYIDNVFLETARKLPGGPPATWVEECTCPEGHVGMSCEECAVGFMRKTCGGDQLDECVKCDCGKLAQCSGPDESGLVAAARVSCGCPEANVAPAEATTTIPPPETTTMPPPTTTTEPPQPCVCNTTGAVGEAECHPGTSDCVCKQNVQGRPACDACSEGHFNLEESDPLGCVPCFCFGHARKCSSAPGYNFLPVRSVFAKGYGKWTMQDSKGNPLQIQWSKPSQDLKAPATDEGQQLYFIAPDSYLGEQRRSFNKFLNFTLYVDNTDGFLQIGDEDIILEGNGLRVALIAFNDNMLPGKTPQNYSFRIHPDAGWEPKLTVPQFIKLLSKLTALKIRATYTEKGTGFLDNVFLETARKLPGGEPVGWVEECECPPAYAGLSCEECASGYQRSECGGDSFSPCVPCDCSKKCPDTGEVQNKCQC